METIDNIKDICLVVPWRMYTPIIIYRRTMGGIFTNYQVYSNREFSVDTDSNEHSLHSKLHYVKHLSYC